MSEKLKIKKMFGLRLRELRDKSHVSQEALADRCGLDRTYISGLERGLRNPSLVCVFRLAEGLNIEVEELVKGFGMERVNESD